MHVSLSLTLSGALHVGISSCRYESTDKTSILCLVQKMQLMQNAAARLLTGPGYWQHATLLPVVTSLLLDQVQSSCVTSQSPEQLGPKAP